MKNQGVAAVAAIFFGGFGFHKFYLGKPGQGLLYLFFFWTAIPFFIGIFEGIYYAVISAEQFNAEYNSGGNYNHTNREDKLLKLNTLRKEGVLTDQEFDREKRKIIG